MRFSIQDLKQVSFNKNNLGVIKVAKKSKIISKSRVEELMLQKTKRQLVYSPIEKIGTIVVDNFPELGKFTALRFSGRSACAGYASWKWREMRQCTAVFDNTESTTENGL